MLVTLKELRNCEENSLVLYRGKWYIVGMNRDKERFANLRVIEDSGIFGYGTVVDRRMIVFNAASLSARNAFRSLIKDY